MTVSHDAACRFATVLDSSGRVRSGFVAGEYGDFGAFDACLAIDVPSPRRFHGRHCLYKLHLPLPPRDQNARAVQLRGTRLAGSWLERLARVYKFLYAQTHVNGLCYPSTCTNADLEPVIQHCKSRGRLRTRIIRTPSASPGVSSYCVADEKSMPRIGTLAGSNRKRRTPERLVFV